MDSKHGRKVDDDQKMHVSVLQGEDPYLFSRIISRNSSVGRSSRIFYYRSAEGVPFKWEMLPGTPRNPPEEDILPPISPPPAILSLSLPKPCIELEEPKSSIRSRLKFWKYMKKIHGTSKMITSCRKGSSQERPTSGNKYFDKFERSTFENCSSSDGEFMASPPRNSSFSSSSSLSHGHGHYSGQLSRLGSTAPRHSMHEPYGCSPWTLNSFLVYVTRRV